MFIRPHEDRVDVCTCKACESLLLILKPQANVELAKSWSGKTVFERITNLNDLASITLNYDDGERQDILVLWNKASKAVNRYETAVLLKNGDLIIMVSKEQTVKDWVERYEVGVQQYYFEG